MTMRLISIGEDQVLYCEACESTFVVSNTDPLGVCPVCGAAPATNAVRTVALEAVEAERDYGGE